MAENVVKSKKRKNRYKIKCLECGVTMNNDYRSKHNKLFHEELLKQYRPVRYEKLDAPKNPFEFASSSRCRADATPAKIPRVVHNVECIENVVGESHVGVKHNVETVRNVVGESSVGVEYVENVVSETYVSEEHNVETVTKVVGENSSVGVEYVENVVGESYVSDEHNVQTLTNVLSSIFYTI